MKIKKIILSLAMVMGVVCTAPVYGVDKNFQQSIEAMADMEVLKISDEEFYITGTRGASINIYKTADLKTRSLNPVYVYTPATKDTQHIYCGELWAPDLAYINGEYILSFSAFRINKNYSGGCKSRPLNQTYAIYEVKADELDGFGVPHLASYGGKTSSQNVYAPGVNVPKIDSALGLGRFFYVFFNGGNSIASVNLKGPSDLVIHRTAKKTADIDIQEAPEVFERKGKKYLIFSENHWDSSYTSAYMFGDDVTKLTDNKQDFYFAEPIQRPGCQLNDKNCIFENAGHGAVTSRYGKYYYVYHKFFPIEGGSRHAYITPLYFHQDGRIVSITSTKLTWASIGDGYRYSLDVKPKNKDWIGPCIDAGTIGLKTSIKFGGLCYSRAANNRVVHKGEVEKFRICAAINGDWAHAICKVVENDVTKDIINIGDIKDNNPVKITSIPDNCKIWFDGCNTCTRNSEGGVMGCTKKACKLSPDAKAYCKEYFTNTSTDKKITADVNQDGKITVVDAVLTLKKSVGYKITDLKNMGWNDTLTTGDVNCDNKVTVVDAVLILKKTVGYKTEDLKNMGWCVE